MKIAYVTNYPPRSGRLSQYALNLIDKMQNLPEVDQIYVITEKQTQKEKVITVNDKVTIYRVWKSDNPLSFLSNP